MLHLQDGGLFTGPGNSKGVGNKAPALWWQVKTGQRGKSTVDESAFREAYEERLAIMLADDVVDAERKALECTQRAFASEQGRNRP